MRTMRKLLLAIGVLAFPCIVHAQGLLPPAGSTSTVVAASQGPITIGLRVLSSLVVKDSDGDRRTLLSYRAATDVFVIAFFSPDCAENKKEWTAWGRLYQAYKDWHVDVVAVHEGGTVEHLRKELDQVGMTDVPILLDADGELKRYFKINQVPMMVLLDEDSVLRYRGSLNGFSVKDKSPQPYAKAALTAVIGHVNEVPAPEPRPTPGCTLP